MKAKKFGIISSLMILSMITIGGCTTTYKDMQDWVGQPIDELYWDWGQADEVVDAGDHDRVHTWITTWTDDGEEKTCRKSFTTRNYGYAEEIIDWASEGCPFLTVDH